MNMISFYGFVVAFLDFTFLVVCLMGLSGGKLRREEVGALSSLAILLLMNIICIVLETRW